MRILIWNIRGLGNEARKKQLKEVMKERDVDIIALQETKRECFTDREFNSFQGSKDFVWGWKSARGSAGGCHALKID